MLVDLDVRSGVPLYRQILDQVRARIVGRALAVGEQLPSVRDLASELGVNPMTVSKAYSLLESEGLVTRRRGIGLFVADLKPSERESEGMALLEGALREAALRCIQLGIDGERAAELLLRLCDDLRHETTGERT